MIVFFCFERRSLTREPWLASNSWWLSASVSSVLGQQTWTTLPSYTNERLVSQNGFLKVPACEELFGASSPCLIQMTKDACWLFRRRTVIHRAGHPHWLSHSVFRLEGVKYKLQTHGSRHNNFKENISVLWLHLESPEGPMLKIFWGYSQGVYWELYWSLWGVILKLIVEPYLILLSFCFLAVMRDSFPHQPPWIGIFQLRVIINLSSF